MIVLERIVKDVFRPDSVVYAIPVAASVADAAGQCFEKWQHMGYRTAALIDGDAPAPPNADGIIRVDEYPGYGGSVNELCRHLTDFDWVVTGGHDTFPADKPAQVIAAELTAHFGGTFGVMQPTGDLFNDSCINHFCGSPWMGREFRRRANAGKGPYWPDYQHY
jgi:hypothetical protein